MNALSVITDAYEWLNRLSPGETLNDDDSARGFFRLNKVVDKMSAKRQFLFKAVLTSAAQTGNITLGAGAWAAIAPGSKIISATSNGLALSPPITMQQYNQIYDTTTGGGPNVWAQDGLSTVYLYPLASGQTIKLQTQVGVAQFVDQTTDYIVAPGIEAMLGIELAVQLAPALLGTIPPELAREARDARVDNYDPAILDTYSYSGGGYRSRILSGP